MPAVPPPVRTPAPVGARASARRSTDRQNACGTMGPRNLDAYENIGFGRIGSNIVEDSDSDPGRRELSLNAGEQPKTPQALVGHQQDTIPEDRPDMLHDMLC